ncbi:uncharacterized protein LOC143575472 [Bidens hawaiensis]|uniref:uncharacterized protein LOC143575472 n=1 Tax=Bidens hawaiensis TaxID=980011 RepID=UPI00404ADEF0
MCEEEIYSFHVSYYTCNDCDYSLHKFCAELPETQQNHPFHPDHSLRLYKKYVWRCHICRLKKQNSAYCYYCYICKFRIDIVCATMSVQKMDHPSHPHQLQRYFGHMMSYCNSCGDEHSGTFYHCTTCSWFRIHLSCALLPAKLLIQQSTNKNFGHSHLLTLSYSFPYNDLKVRYFPRCRVCLKGFDFHEPEDKSYLWHYRCDKCRYYVHVDCAISMKDAFMSSILMPAGYGKTYKNFKDEDHPNLIHCPFADENVNLLTHHFLKKGESVIKRFCHPHPLVLFDTILNGSVSLHDPMKKVELLCDGCVRPITTMPFYKCSQHDCDFVLHEWCTMLPSQIQDHPHHPEHTLVFVPKTPTNSLGLFDCGMCELPCNGFSYGCMQCEYYVDISCGFIPDVITHEAHPNHLLLRIEASSLYKSLYCKACTQPMYEMGFYCPTCDFYLHSKCALLLPRIIRHKYDKHPLTLMYYPAKNHKSEYFCEICEDEFDPAAWFYHCNTCAYSMHTACAPLKLRCEQSTFYKYLNSIFEFLNVKFGRRTKLRDHPHPVTFVQGIKDDGQCIECDRDLQYEMIFKCFQCKFALHYWCGLSYVQETLYMTSHVRL